MRLRHALAGLACLLATPVAAQCTGQSYFDMLAPDERASLEAAAAAIPFGEGSRWTAEKDGKVIDLVGTVHIYDPRLEPVRDGLGKALAQADLLLVEATGEDELALQDLLAREPGRLFLNEGPTLIDLLEPDAWEALAAAARARQIPPFMAAKMQPWYLSMLLSIPECAASALMQGQLGLDKLILQDAKAAGVPVRSLESYTTVLDIFRDEPLEEQVQLMMTNLQAADRQEAIFVATLDSYFEERVAELWELSRFAMRDVPGMTAEEAEAAFAETEAALLVDRNRAWMPVILGATEAHDRLLVAVGAAHLIGEHGLLALLEADGWELSRGQLSP